MEGLVIYADEFVEFRSRFRDLDAEIHCHPSLQLMFLFGPGAKCQKWGFSASFAKFVLKMEVVCQTKHSAGDGSAADASFEDLGVFCL